MWTDVIDLRDFYASSLGQVARRMIRRQLRVLWPDVRGMRVLGLGYPVPFILPFREEAERVVSVMPAAQGVLRWPPDAPNIVALSDETELPFPDLSFDRVLLVHAVECSEQLRPMLREIWRVLSGDGRLIAVVPNRRGIWARTDRTPFGHGLPYSTGQLSRLLRDTMFAPMENAGALFVPPSRRRVLLGSASAWEQIGQRWFPGFAGAVLVEAGKQLYAASAAREPRRRRAEHAPAIQGVGRLRDLT